MLEGRFPLRGPSIVNQAPAMKLPGLDPSGSIRNAFARKRAARSACEKPASAEEEGGNCTAKGATNAGANASNDQTARNHALDALA